MFIFTEKNKFAKALDTNSTATSFTNPTPTTVEPTGSGVVDCASNNAFIVFFGAGSDTNTFNARLIGWRPIDGLWIPTPLADVAVTLSTPVGIAGQTVVATDRFADTLVVSNSITGYDVCSPANDTIAHLRLDLGGCAKLEVCIDVVSATNGNAIVSFF